MLGSDCPASLVIVNFKLDFSAVIPSFIYVIALDFVSSQELWDINNTTAWANKTFGIKEDNMLMKTDQTLWIAKQSKGQASGRNE